MQYSLLVFFVLARTVLSVVVNPLPKPISVSWGNDSAKEFKPSIVLDTNDDTGFVGAQFEEMLQTLKKLQWYPAATEGPRSSFESTPTNPAKTFGKRKESSHGLAKLKVHVDSMEDLQYGVNESYILEVDDDIKINSPTVWGALHGLKTLQQLIIYKNGKYLIEGSVKIEDDPLFPHRGVLIDSGRNYLSIEAIKTNIDLMSLAKLNTLHWHLADTQSWPVEIKAFENMTDDAYSPWETYSQYDIQDIIKYAYKKGVRVIPEIDLPGHSNAGWRQIDPSLIPCGKGWWLDGIAVEPPAGQLDISLDETYEVVETIFDELNELFTDDFFHVGHDELQPSCYNSSRSVFEWYEDNDGNFTDLLQYWVNNSLPIFTKNESTKLIMWEDIVTSEGISIPKEVMLQVWISSGSIKTLTKAGYDIIVSASDHYYLDCGFGGWVTNNTKSAGSWCDPYKSWQNIYSFDFYANLTKEEQSHIKGLEVALWSEMVDSSNLVQKIWSRTAAFAEVAWSGNKDDEGNIRVSDLTQRIFNYREYLVALGHSVDPLVPKYCIQNPHACDV